jgi:Protein of unknown function (DUF4038)/Putative collagen-binding domain of a collagenase
MKHIAQILLLASVATLAAAPVFPLKVSTDGRYLADATGQPLFYHADTAWALPRNAKLADAEEYFELRAKEGFTAIHLHAVTKEVGSVKNVNGDEPFTPLNDILKPNEAYWRQLDAVLIAAEKRRLLAAVSALWIRWGGRDKEGWRNQLTEANARAYGEFLGRRYAPRKNILWILGGDDNPHEDRAAIALMARALKKTAPHHLVTVHNQPEHSSSAFFANEPWLDVNAAYTYREVAPHVLAEWHRPYANGKPKPIFLIESGYEHESNDQRGGAAHRVRRQSYGAILSGALMGHAYGHREVWRFSSKWREGIADVGSKQMRHARDLFASRAWWKLRPDLENELVPSRIDRVSPGDVNWAAAARANDGSFALVYLPANRAVVVDVTKVAAQTKASWFDPADGSTQSAADKPWRNTPWKEFTPPAKNAAGDGDFVLLFEAGDK